MTGISEKRIEVIVRTSRKSRKIGQHRITKTTKNQLCPNQRSQVTKCDTKICRCIANACFGLMFQLFITFRARACPRKSHKTMKSSERLAKRPTTKTRYLPSLPWDLRTCVNVEPGYFKSRSWARFSESVVLWHSVLWQETPKFWTQQRFHSRQGAFYFGHLYGLVKIKSAAGKSPIVLIVTTIKTEVRTRTWVRPYHFIT